MGEISMNIDSDMEIIKSALIYGDMDDAENIIQKRIVEMKFLLKRHKNQIYQSYLSFLQALDSLLRVQIDLESFKQQVGNIHGIENLLEGNAGEHGYLSSLFYLLQLSMDRYNVAYPKYDMKRCDDL